MHTHFTVNSYGLLVTSQVECTRMYYREVIMITGTMIYNKALSDAIDAINAQPVQTHIEYLTLRDAIANLKKLKK